MGVMSDLYGREVSNLMPMSSCLLYHGPGAKQIAFAEASDFGHVHERAYGLEGLKAAEAREVAELLQSPPFAGEQRFVVIIGPLDLARPKSSDALLKSIEEFDSKRVLPVLWTRDIGQITTTILSRCQLRWCSGDDPFEDAPLDALQRARGLLTSLLAQDVAGLCLTLREEKNIEGLYLALVHVLAWERPNASLWVRLRPLAGLPQLHYSELLSVLLEAVDE